MANNETQNPSPKVSKLPLPISDSPLVIDLPDGQKIVVGKMVQGSVIEVATWRGVGRPDSRTSRLMLGMGTGNVNEDSNSSESASSHSSSATKPPQKPAGFAGVVFTVRHFLTNFNRIKWGSTFKALFKSITAKRANNSKALAEVAGSDNAVESPASAGVIPGVKVSRVSEDSEIEEWLNSISLKANSASRKPGKSSSASKSRKKVAAKPKKTVKKSVAKPKGTRRPK